LVHRFRADWRVQAVPQKKLPEPAKGSGNAMRSDVHNSQMFNTSG
jgi:hypothetical protein